VNGLDIVLADKIEKIPIIAEASERELLRLGLAILPTLDVHSAPPLILLASALGSAAAWRANTATLPSMSSATRTC
jgi:hypothetical protein